MVGNEFQVSSGVDSYVDGDVGYKLSFSIVQEIPSKGNYYLNHAKKQVQDPMGYHYWKSVYDFGCKNDSAIEWDGYIKYIKHNFIRLNYFDDVIAWSWNLYYG